MKNAAKMRYAVWIAEPRIIGYLNVTNTGTPGMFGSVCATNTQPQCGRSSPVKHMLSAAVTFVWADDWQQDLFAPEHKQDDPLDLSILLSGGKEINKDYLSKGDWTGKSSKLKSNVQRTFEL